MSILGLGCYLTGRVWTQGEKISMGDWEVSVAAGSLHSSIFEQYCSLIFTYGTLKRGFPNHAIMANLIRSGDVTFRGEYTTVDAYPLVCGPYGIPYLINLPGSGVRIKGELYAVTDSGIVPMDDLEGVEAGHYERLPLKLTAGDGGGPEGTVAAEAYFAHRSFGEGLWKRCGGVGIGDFTTEMASKYQIKEERPQDFNFLKDLELFISGVE